MATKIRNHGGLVHRTLQAGSFYRCSGCGEFQDSSCGIIIPGCQAVVDERLRVITELRLPDYVVQIPHAKMSVKFGRHPEDRLEWVEMPFTDYCPQGIGEALQQACDTGVIVEVPDEEVQSLWPECWKARREKIVFDPRQIRTGTAEPMLDLIERAKRDRLAEARAATKQAHEDAASAAK